ncbi:MAG: hypothetical protein II817_01345 [Bacteroidales bacterium]|nr:hypothetical protein [Bacteroidales bacterium]
MSITEKINEIIDRRIGRNGFEGKGHLEAIKKKKAFFEGLMQTLLDYQTLRENVLMQINNQKGEYYSMSLEDPTLQQKIELADPSSAILQLQKCQSECERLEKRFNRETINISVVGRAGQGKSRLLQSISGVENEIIPADTGGDCTGAKSTIANAPGKTYAHIKFYNEQEIVTQVNAYLEKLGVGYLSVGSASRIQNIPIDTIEVTTTSQQSLLEQLRKYVEHYDKYCENLGSERDVDKSKIRYYVAQYETGKPDHNFYAYLGVKEVTIYTQFPTEDVGKVMLVDTIGLGDTSLDLEKKMLDTLVNDSDAAIVVRKADAQRDGIRNEDDQLYDMLAEALGNSGLEYWLFYAINACVALHNEVTGGILLEALQKKQASGAQKFADLMLVNCGNENDVREKLLLPMLNFLAENLQNVDNNLMREANNQFANCYQKYFDLCSKVGNVLSGGFRKSLQAGGLFDELYEDKLGLTRELKALMDKYADQNAKCELISDNVKSIIRNIASHCPTREEIQYRLTSGGEKGHAPNVYLYYADNLRAIVRDEFEQINRSTITGLQDDFKREVCDVLGGDAGGRLKRIPVQTEVEITGIEWAEALLLEKLGDYPLIAEAIRDIAGYRLNIEGLVEFKVDNAISCLDYFPQNKRFVMPDFTGLSDDEIVFAIEQSLQNSIPTIADDLMEGIQELLLIPYHSFRARIRKLNDRLVFKKDGQRELRNFYRDNAPTIWPDEFKSVASKEVALGQLNDSSAALNSKRSKDLFILKLE